MYTCTNPKCVPDFSKEEFYSEEFAFIQLSSDFANVKYGDANEI